MQSEGRDRRIAESRPDGSEILPDISEIRHVGGCPRDSHPWMVEGSGCNGVVFVVGVAVGAAVGQWLGPGITQNGKSLFLFW